MALPTGPGAVTIDGRSIAFHSDGYGRTLIFVHGMLADHGIWDGHISLLSSDYNILRPTLSYFGATPWADDGASFSVDFFADELGIFISNLELEAATVVGWSFGGAVALSLAARRPDLIKELVLYEPSLANAVQDEAALQAAMDSRDRTFAAARVAYAANDPMSASEAFIDGVNGKVGTCKSLPTQVQNVFFRNARVLKLFFSDPPPPSVTLKRLGSVSQKTTILLGEKSRTFWQVAVPALVNRLPNAEMKHIPGARHMWPVEAPDEFSEEVLNYLG